MSFCHRPSPSASVSASAGGSAGQKLMVFAGEQAREQRGAPLYSELVRRLREAGASGATSLRGFWGYHGDQAPHGEPLLGAAPPVPS